MAVSPCRRVLREIGCWMFLWFQLRGNVLEYPTKNILRIQEDLPKAPRLDRFLAVIGSRLSTENPWSFHACP